MRWPAYARSGVLLLAAAGLFACQQPHPPQTLGEFDPATATFHLTNPDGTELSFVFGLPGEIPLAGDVDGDGVDTVGVYHDGEFAVRTANSAGLEALVGAPFGKTTVAQPLFGKWFGQGKPPGKTHDGDIKPDFPALYEAGQVLLASGEIWTGPVTPFTYGNPGDVAFSGDWDGDGIDSLGVYRPSDGCIFLRNSNTTGIHDIKFCVVGGGQPVPGDWDGTGIETVAMCAPTDSTDPTKGTLTVYDHDGGAGPTRPCNPQHIQMAGHWVQ